MANFVNPGCLGLLFILLFYFIIHYD